MLPPALRRALGAALTLGLLAVAPAAADAATSVSITGDAGAPVPLVPGAPPTVRNIDPDLTVAFGAEEAMQKYSIAVTGPAGEAAGFATTCLRKSGVFPTGLYYRGNGSYAVSITTHAQDDTNCTRPALRTESFPYVVQASAPVTGPAVFSLRSARSSTRNQVPLQINLNPGNPSYELRYALNGTIGPDGGIVGGGELGSVNSTTGQSLLFLTTPGLYTVVARAKGFGGGAEVPTPWSPPLQVLVTAPFDSFGNLSFLDRIGPSYSVRLGLREKSARGRVRIAYARGTKGGKYRSLGTATIATKGTREGTVTKRFRLTRRGTYRLKFSYGGSKTIRAGSETFKITITRTFR